MREKCIFSFFGVFLLLAAGAIAAPASAGVIEAAGCSQQDVQAAVDKAVDGDTVLVPEGTARWTTVKAHMPCVRIENKAITLKGAGTGETRTTIICDTGTSYGPEDPIHITGGTGKPFRITGFVFDGLKKDKMDNPIVINNGSYLNFRIDHCRFQNLYHAIRISGGRIEGLIDNCSFSCLEEQNDGDHVAIGVDGDKGPAWKRPVELGSSHAVFVEDCVFDYYAKGNPDRPYVAMGEGARVVFRHNKGNNGCIEVFGASPQVFQRGSVSLEVYENEFSGKCYCLITQKGGTGVCYNNTITGAYDKKTLLELTDYRSNSPHEPYGKCDGMSCLDGDEAIDTGRHTGADDQAGLVCAGKTWTPDQWAGFALWNETDDSVGKIVGNTADTIRVESMVEGYGILDSGVHSGADDAVDLTCAGKQWGWSKFRYLYVYNVTDGGTGKITANKPDVVFAELTGGNENDWDNGDQFLIVQCRPRPVVEKDWDTGDIFKIVDGYPCLDQVGRAGDKDEDDMQPQFKSPVYEWNNTLNGEDVDYHVNTSGLIPAHIRENRDFFNDTPRPGYKAYRYPHPLQFVDDITDIAPASPGTVRIMKIEE